MDFWERLDELVARRSNRRAVSEALALGPNTIATWKTRKAYPEPNLLLRLADHLNVSVRYLVTGEFDISDWCRDNVQLINALTRFPPRLFPWVQTRLDKVYGSLPPKWIEYQKSKRYLEFANHLTAPEIIELKQKVSALAADPEVVKFERDLNADLPTMGDSGREL